MDSADFYSFAEDSTSVWNLKTGERIDKFSDLFYEGEDFVPVVNRAVDMFINDLSYFLKTEPKDFSTATLILDASFNSAYLGGDQKDLAVNALSEAFDFMPAWEFYDMSPLFINPHNVRTETADLYIEDRIRYEDMLECYIGTSRFLSDSEIAALNADIAKIYRFIEVSDVYKNFEYENEWYEPFSTRVELSEDNIISVRTPFGLYLLDRETGVIDSPQTNPSLKGINIHGIIDIDLDGDYEYYTRLSNVITVYDSEVDEIGRYDFDETVRTINAWQVIKEDGKISGRIIVNDLTVFDYHIENGVTISDGLKTLGVSDSGRYYVKSGGFGNVTMELGYPCLTTKLKTRTESVIYLNCPVGGGGYLYETDFTNVDKIAEKLKKMKESGKPYLLVAGKELFEITDISDKYVSGAVVNVRVYGNDNVLTELSDPFGIG
jgi:hypothetical protein